MIADDSKTNPTVDLENYSFRIEYYRMPYDWGTGRGRNLLVSQITTKYVVTLDDDFEFGPFTKYVNFT